MTTYDKPLCPHCNGSGEGQVGESICRACNGSGVDRGPVPEREYQAAWERE